MNRPKILDATCGGRMLWFEKNYPGAIYMDKTIRPPGCKAQWGRPNFSCVPDVVADFTNMPFPDDTFDLVVFDPPHASVNLDSAIGIEYGTLEDLKMVIRGFRECWRVLKPGCVLVFKWAENKYTVRAVLDALPASPLFGHTTGKSGKTKWMLFLKIGHFDTSIKNGR